jgi:TonB-dependent receptor
MKGRVSTGVLRASTALGLVIGAALVGCAAAEAQTQPKPGSDGVTNIGTVSTADQIEIVPSKTGTKAQAEAAKRDAPNVIDVQPQSEIEKLPDVSVAEALQRVPGISMESDTGEGRFINIRGMDADLNGTTYEGVHLTPSNQSSPLGGARAVAFDAFPAGIIGGVEVVKSLTPDMDAEGLGGSVNLLSRSLPADGRPVLEAEFGGGYEPLRDTPIWKGTLTAGGMFGLGGGPWDNSGTTDRPFGFIGTFARYDDARGIDDVEEDYSDTAGIPNKALQDLQMRWYEYHRQRQGGAVQFTYKLDDRNSFYIRALDSGYEEQADKHRLELDNLDGSNGSLTTLPNGAFLIQGAAAKQTFTDSDEKVHNNLIDIGGQSIVGQAVKVDYRAAWTSGTDSMPFNYGTKFKGPDIPSLTYDNSNPAAETWTASGINVTNPGLYKLKTITNAPFQDSDTEWSGAIDVTLPVDFFDADEQVKVGTSLRFRSRGNSQNQMTYDPVNSVLLSQLVSGGNQIYYNGLYNIGPNISNQALLGVPVVRDDTSKQGDDYISNAEAFQHDSENVYAGYGQYQITAGKWGLLGGLRIEDTEAEYRANVGTTDPTGSITTITPNVLKQSYIDYFPSLQLRYAVEPDFVVHLAYSTGIARPGFQQITAAKTVDDSADQVTQGNPNLKPTTGNSLDLSAEYYTSHGGQLSNYIVQTNAQLPNYRFGSTYTLFSFENIGGAYVNGLEFTYIQPFTFLPAPFDGFGFEGNYTYDHSHGQIRPGEYASLPETSLNNFNAAIYYEQGPYEARLASSYVSSNVFSIGSDRSTDIFSRPRFRLDFGASYAITDQVKIGFDAKNLTNTPLEFTESDVASRPIQREFYDQTYLFTISAKY